MPVVLLSVIGACVIQRSVLDAGRPPVRCVVCLLRSLVHIELAAVDLSWDIIVRFGTNPSYQLPKPFFDDFVQVRSRPRSRLAGADPVVAQDTAACWCAPTHFPSRY